MQVVVRELNSPLNGRDIFEAKVPSSSLVELALNRIG